MVKYSRRKVYRKRAPIRSRGIRKRMSYKKTLPYKARSRRYGPKHIRVKSLGLNSSFDKIALRPNRLGASMRKKYWLGAKNIWQKDILTFASNTGGLSQSWVETGYFSKVDLMDALTAYAQAPGATGTLANTARIFWNKCIAEIMMTNASNTNVEIDIYTFSLKRDVNQTPGSAFSNGMEDSTAQTLVDVAQTNYGLTPLDSVLVSSLYKCFKVTHLQLNPGQSHRHSFTQHLCRPINNEVVDLANDNVLVGLRGITMYEMFVVRSSSIATGSNNVGEAFAPAKVNFNINKKYEFKYLFDNDTNYKYVYSTPSTTNNLIYNQGSGVAATPVVI